MPRSKRISRAYLDQLCRRMPPPDEGPQAQLDFLLPEARRRQSDETRSKAQYEFLAQNIKSALLELHYRTGAIEYKAKTGKTMGMLVWNPKTLSGDRGAKVARAIREKAGEIDQAAAVYVVKAKETTTYTVDWEIVKSLGSEFTEFVKKTVGINPTPSLRVGPVTKRQKLNKPRRKRR